MIRGCTDADVATQCFNSYCLEILNLVAPLKTVIAAPKRTHPWINNDIRKVKRLCRKAECLWKSTKLIVHRLHLRELWVSLHETIKSARSGYFSQFISSNKINSKLLFETMNFIVSPMDHQVPMSSISESDDFLNFFLDTVNNVLMSIGYSILSVCVSGTPPLHLLSVFNPLTIHDLSLFLDKMKITTCPNDILPAVLFKKCSLCHCRNMKCLSFNRGGP